MLFLVVVLNYFTDQQQNSAISAPPSPHCMLCQRGMERGGALDLCESCTADVADTSLNDVEVGEPLQITPAGFYNFKLLFYLINCYSLRHTLRLFSYNVINIISLIKYIYYYLGAEAENNLCVLCGSELDNERMLICSGCFVAPLVSAQSAPPPVCRRRRHNSPPPSSPPTSRPRLDESRPPTSTGIVNKSLVTTHTHTRLYLITT